MWKTCITATLEDVTVEMQVAMVNGKLRTKLDRLRAWGCDGIELLTLGQLSKESYQETQRLLNERGVEVCAVSSGAIRTVLDTTLLGGGPRGEEVLIRLINAAQWLHAPIVTIGSFRGLTDRRKEAPAQLRSIVRRAAEYARDRNVTLAIEPLNRYETDYLVTVDDVLSFVETVGMDNVGVLPDLFHVNIEEASMPDSIARCLAAKRLVHLHAADSNRKLPGRGHIDFAAIRDTLQLGEYAGAVSGELERGEVPEEDAVQEYCDFLNNLKDTLSTV